MSIYGLPRPTPWVWRLIIANAVVLLLLTALLPALVPSLLLQPDVVYAFRHPWTFLSYMFVHAGLWHLVFNMLILYSLGTRVEERMGSKTFILFYLYCGLGGALFSLGLAAAPARRRRRGLGRRPRRGGGVRHLLARCRADGVPAPLADQGADPRHRPVGPRRGVRAPQPGRRRGAHRAPGRRRLRVPLLPPPAARWPGALDAAPAWPSAP